MAHEQLSSGSIKDDHCAGTCAKDATFAVPTEDIHRSESRLLKLLNEFNSGNMLSFGPNCPYEKLDAIRDQQEELMRLHFEQDKKMQTAVDSSSRRSKLPDQSLISEDGWKSVKTNVNTLITKLESLSSAIEDLHRTKRPV